MKYIVDQKDFIEKIKKHDWNYARYVDRFVNGADKDDYKKWKGFRLLAIDGSCLTLPQSNEIIKDFGFAKNLFFA